MENTVSRMPLSTPPTKPTNWWRTLPGQAAILALGTGLIAIILGLTGIIGPRAHGNPLTGTDPSGAAACSTLADWIRSDLPVSKATVTQLVTADAQNAHTGDIKRSAATVSMRTGDLVDIRTACADAGVRMPPYAEPVG